MKISNIGNFTNNSFIQLKNNDWLIKQRVAGKIAAQTLLLLQNEVSNNTSKTLLELNDLAETFIIKSGGTCTFKNYKGFPFGVCMSVNKELVHGMPRNYRLQDGDLISFDLGVTYQGAIADTAITCIFGKPKSEQHANLINVTNEALMAGINAISIGNQLGCIGYAINKCTKKYGFAIVNNYGGHGLSWNEPHASPFVENKSEINNGIRIQPGLTIAIEPMLVINSAATKVLNDGWTVVTNDIGSHFEHSIFVHQDHIEIITDRNGL